MKTILRKLPWNKIFMFSFLVPKPLSSCLNVFFDPKDVFLWSFQSLLQFQFSMVLLSMTWVFPWYCIVCCCKFYKGKKKKKTAEHKNTWISILCPTRTHYWTIHYCNFGSGLKTKFCKTGFNFCRIFFCRYLKSGAVKRFLNPLLTLLGARQGQLQQVADTVIH